MRMWMCSPKIMCKNHLLGEHNECHMFLGSLKKRINIDGYIKNDLLEPLSLKNRHDALADEMIKRGYNHNSNLIFDENIIFSYLPAKYINHRINKENSLNILINKCLLCNQNFKKENIMYSITKSFKFEAAHRLLTMEEGHHCRNIHGHSYVVRTTIQIVNITLMKNPNMVVDFGKLKKFKEITEALDHKLILNSNDPLIVILKDVPNVDIIKMPDGLDPTAENMAYLFAHNLKDLCTSEFGIEKATIKVDVDETVGNTASYTLFF